MLVKYEYELLSYIATKGTNKVNFDLAVSIKRINLELDEDIHIYLENLKLKGLITIEENTITIKSEKWVKYFVEKLNEEFKKNKLEIICDFKQEKFAIEFSANGSIKNFNLILNENNISPNKYEEDSIFMCMPNYYEDRIFWLDLLNDVNTLLLFSSYISNEISNINKERYRKIVEFDGINDAYVSEIFSSSIKEYFEKISKNIIEFPQEYNDIVRKILKSENHSYYGVEFDNEILLILKKNREIIFLTYRNKELVYSEQINNEINKLNDKIINKLSQYRKLLMFRENNIIDNSLKLISNLAVFFVPFTMIINILGFFNLNLDSVKNYKWLLIIIMAVLAFIQGGIIYLIYIPAIRMSRFKWKL